MQLQPTEEQEAALELYLDGDTFAIEAGAGTGKSTTLRLMAEAQPGRQCQYLAFNRSIVEEAKRTMPDNVRSSTAHSAAFGSVGRTYAHRLRSERQRSDEVARQLNLGHLTVSYGQQKKVLQPGFLAGLTMRAVARFCQSADKTPGREHVPYIEGIDPPDSAGGRSYRNNDEVRAFIEPALGRAWEDLIDPKGSLRFSHDVYLKLFQLRRLSLGADVILFDEAQDAAPVMLAIVENQADSQVVWVGDSQQQIYSWRGATNALSRVDVRRTTYLTQSFRFGPAIAEVANAILSRLDTPLRLRGWTVDSVVGPLDQPRAVLCRTNATAVSTVMRYQAGGVPTHLIGGGSEVSSFARAARELQQTGRCYHPELACFDSWGQVQEYVEKDALGDELKLMVELVDEYGVDVIIKALESGKTEAQARVVVSTAHKAKGREWPTVQLAGDFKKPDDDAAEEWRLSYVASTRAILGLDIDRVPHLTGEDDDHAEPVLI